MKYILCINQPKALDLGINSVNQAHIFDLLTSAASWASPIIIQNNVFYWVSRQTIGAELALLKLKPDTVYRHLKSLQKTGLINYKKVGKKDCIQITEKGKKYLTKKENSTMSEINPNHYVGNKSERLQNSEINPNKLGFISEKNSDLNPTYPSTRSDQSTNYPLSNKRESSNFKNFKNIVENSNFKFNLAGKLGYSENHAGFEIRGGYIFSLHTQKFLEKDEAFQIWQYLFSQKDKVLMNLQKAVS